MPGITEIGTYIPKRKISNYLKKDRFDITDSFITEKIGVESISVKEKSEKASDLCLKAFDNLAKKTDIDRKEIDTVILVTQNPDYMAPHTSAIIHGKLGLEPDCASFDISLGCSGFVYGLAAISSFMKSYNKKKGLLFTCDPYSEIINLRDKNTSMLFGDAAAVTLITDNPVFEALDYSFGTLGTSYKELIIENNELFMNGRAVSNFAAKIVTRDIIELLEKNKMSREDIDSYLFHQGSRFIISNLTKKLRIPKEKVAYDIYNYGNTISSSIPILLEKYINNTDKKSFLISGFGVGLSWANSILERV